MASFEVINERETGGSACTPIRLHIFRAGVRAGARCTQMRQVSGLKELRHETWVYVELVAQLCRTSAVESEVCSGSSDREHGLGVQSSGPA